MHRHGDATTGRFGPAIHVATPLRATAPLLTTLLAAVTMGVALAAPAGAQQLRGRVLDSSNGQPVQLAGVRLLDRDRDPVALAIADSVGRYLLTVPDSGEYFIVAERFGYFETVSPLLSIPTDRDYDLDLELRPEPIRVEGIDVTVRNEEVIDWLQLEFGLNPVQFFGFRILQGERLQEAKQRGKLNPTETLRWLYIPVSNGACVRINPVERSEIVSLMSGPRMRFFEPGGVPGGTAERVAAADGGSGFEGCPTGNLMVNDRMIPAEHLDRIDMTSIALVVTLPNQVRMYTYDFDWAFRDD